MLGGLRLVALVAGAAALGGTTAQAAPCNNTHALGVSRVLTVDARAMPLVGSHDYGFTLPLAPGEVVLTFDDGPVAPYTNQVLRALAHECVQATFFMVGRQARANPELAWQVRAAGTRSARTPRAICSTACPRTARPMRSTPASRRSARCSARSNAGAVLPLPRTVPFQ
jgi:hypothetical protein